MIIYGMNRYFLFILLFIYSCTTTRPVYKQSIEAETLKLCFIGDTGSQDTAQLKVAQLLEKERCHSIHFLGDIIYSSGLRNHHDKSFQKKFWNYYEALTLKDHKPQLNMIMGNHDHRGSLDAWVRLSAKHPKIFFPYPYYLLKINNICITHTDTNYYSFFTNYAMTYSERQWHKTLKKDLNECKIKIALGHHPYDSSGKGHGQSSGLMRFHLDRTVIGIYDYYIAGHDHILSDEREVRNTRLLISGAGGKHDHGFENGFLVMTIKEDFVQYEFRKVPLAK
jgi:predicted phosphodiesterase